MPNPQLSTIQQVLCPETNVFNLKMNVFDSENQQKQTFQFTYTHHARQRASRRSITPKQLSAVLAFGTCFQKQGYEYYVLGKNEMEKYHLDFHLDNTIVVVMHQDIIITTYYAENGFKHIKRKQKTLSPKVKF